MADSNEHPEKMDNHANRPEVIQAFSGSWGQSIRYSRTLQTKMMYVSKPIYDEGQLIGVLRSAFPIEMMGLF